MSILNKFKSVKIENDMRISQTDKEYCEQQQNLYKDALNALMTALLALQAIYNNYVKTSQYDRGYIEKYDDIDHMEKRIEKVKNEFISRIILHFQNTYNVTLESAEIYRKYDITVTYHNIMDEIFEQLGGFNFQEKAVQEVKENISKDVRYDKIEIKNNKLTIQGFIYIDHFDKKWGSVRMSYNSRDKVCNLFKALSHYEIGETELLWYYQNIRQNLNEKNSIYKYDLGHNKVQSFKPFQNGKVEIVFQTNQQAEEFKREYLTK